MPTKEKYNSAFLRNAKAVLKDVLKNEIIYEEKYEYDLIKEIGETIIYILNLCDYHNQYRILHKVRLGSILNDTILYIIHLHITGNSYMRLMVMLGVEKQPTKGLRVTDVVFLEFKKILGAMIHYREYASNKKGTCEIGCMPKHIKIIEDSYENIIKNLSSSDTF